MSYQCGKCGLGVIVIKNNPPIKACNCTAPIIAGMESSIAGVGGINTK